MNAVIERRRRAATGTTVAVEFNTDEKTSTVWPFVTYCEDHKRAAFHYILPDAQEAARRPRWCEECAEILVRGGHAVDRSYWDQDNRPA